MVKSKRMTGILLVIATLVWGIVIYRVINSVHTGSPQLPPALRQASGNIQPEDTLFLDYADPFMKDVVARRKSREKIRPLASPAFVQPQPPAFRYKGKIRKGKTEYLMVEKNGIQHIVSSKEKFDGYQFLKVTPDSVWVRKDKLCYTLFVQ